MKPELRTALIAFGIVSVAVAGFVRLDIDVPFVGHLGSALVAVLLLYAPAFFAWRASEDLADYGFRADPLGRGLAYGIGVPLLVFPIFAVGYTAFFSVICDPDAMSALRNLAPQGVCARYMGWDGVAAPTLTDDLGQFALVQLIVERGAYRRCPCWK